MSDAEKSRLLNKQKAEIVALQKDVKKKKGALKEEAQKKLDEAEKRHEQELKELLEGGSSGEPSVDNKKGKEKEKEKEKEKSKEGGKSKKAKAMPVLDWSGLSKTELEEEAVKRGLSKKGNKEQLTTRLQLWAQDQELERKMAAASTGESSSNDKKKPWPLNKKDEESDEESDDDDDDESSDEEQKPQLTEEELAEAEKQYKREMMFRKALKTLLKRSEDGILVADLPAALDSIGAKNFSAEKLGYKSLEALLEKQPENVCFYDDIKKKVFLPDDE